MTEGHPGTDQGFRGRYADDPRRLKLSNRIGGEYRLEDIGQRQWKRFRTENTLFWDTVSACRELAGRVLAALPAVVPEALEGAGDNGIITKLARRLANRAAAVRRRLGDP